MKNSAMHPKNRHKLVCLLRILTTSWAILGPVAVITAAVVTTLLEGDWWKGFFLACLAFYGLLLYTSYFSLLTVLWELTRRTRRKYGEDIGDTPFTTVLHRILGGVAMAGLGTAVFIPLILFDLLNGGFAIIHFVIGMLEASLYGTLGVYDVIRRIIRRRRAEGQRLEEERQAWEGYLN